MSREIKFRAYIKPLKRYATGLDTIQFHKCCDVTGAGIWTVVTVNEGVFECDDIHIEQYTGLKDKNGKEICEGDIVLDYYDGDDSFIVKWDENTASFILTGTDNIASVSFDNFYSDKDLEVIGNMHENPELLGGEE